MVAVPVFYATTEGQTRRIAQRLAAGLHAHGLDSAPVDLEQSEEAGIDWSAVHGAIVGASIHIGKHQAAAVRFATRHARQLGACPSAFFSVSMSEASKNPRDVTAARALAHGFVDRAQWKPDFVISLAGALVYSKYGWLTRLVMRWISRREGGPTDTSRDYEFTDWAAVDRLAAQLAERIRRAEPVPAAAS
jgi:menaquinone-dependent protoporphyrinogen oxidase